jgi:hypothetical protein
MTNQSIVAAIDNFSVFMSNIFEKTKSCASMKYIITIFISCTATIGDHRMCKPKTFPDSTATLGGYQVFYYWGICGWLGAWLTPHMFDCLACSSVAQPGAWAQDIILLGRDQLGPVLSMMLS